MSERDARGVIYLLHFAKPIGSKTNKLGTAQHYIGWTENLEERLTSHATKPDAAIMRYLKDQGIAFILSRSWNFGPHRILLIARSSRFVALFCGICTPAPRHPPIAHLVQGFLTIDDPFR